MAQLGRFLSGMPGGTACTPSEIPNHSDLSCLGAGRAFMAVMQQISAAVESAGQLEMGELLEHPDSDGTLPSPPACRSRAEGQRPPASAPGLLKRKAADDIKVDGEEAEGSQMPNAKHQRVDERELGNPLAAAAGAQTGSSGANDEKRCLSESTVLDDRPSSLGPADVADDVAVSVSREDDPGGSDSVSHAVANGDAPDLPAASGRGEGKGVASIVLPDQATAMGSEDPGPSTRLPDQATSKGSGLPGPSTQLHHEDQEEDVSPEVKEKGEHARTRSRAWKKVLLDGLDLQAELTAAAAAADPDDPRLAQKCKVGFCMLLQSMQVMSECYCV